MELSCHFCFICTMKRMVFVFNVVILFFLTTEGFSQDTIQNKAFQVGERLEYRVYYHSGVGNVTAGEAILSVDEWKERNTGDDKTVFRFIGKGNSKGLFNFFFKVRDKYESFVNQQTLLPYVFLRETREGGYKKDDKVTFDREKGVATSYSETKLIPEDVQDIVSSLYFMRTISVGDFDADSMYYINFHLDDSVYTSAIKYQGKGMLKTKWGKIRCLKIAPMMATGEVFAEKYPMFIWVSDDENHVPILGESAVIVGSVKMELVKYSGLVKPLEFVEK